MVVFFVGKNNYESEMGGSTINCTSPIDNITLPDDLSATQIAVGAYASCVIQINGGGQLLGKKRIWAIR